MKKFLAIVLALVLVASLGVTAFAAPKTTVIRIGHSDQPDNEINVQLLHFADAVKERTNGEIEIQVFAAEQLDSDDPMAVMGLFDISQRSKAIANYLSLTMPRALWESMSEGLDRSCLTTHSWREIEKRL